MAQCCAHSTALVDPLIMESRVPQGDQSHPPAFGVKPTLESILFMEEHWEQLLALRDGSQAWDLDLGWAGI